MDRTATSRAPARPGPRPWAWGEERGGPEVAWVDGDVSDAERETILHIAKQRGVATGSSDYCQLLLWLDHRPSDEVFRTALEAIRIGLSVLPPEEAQQRIATIIKACEDVARAAGWVAELLELDGDFALALTCICKVS